MILTCGDKYRGGEGSVERRRRLHSVQLVQIYNFRRTLNSQSSSVSLPSRKSRISITNSTMMESISQKMMMIVFSYTR